MRTAGGQVGSSHNRHVSGHGPCPACLRPGLRLPAGGGPSRLTGDAFTADRTQTRTAFRRARRIETEYAAKLRRVARFIHELCATHPVTDLPGALWLRTALEQYADTLTPWAEAVSRTMLTETAARDERSWFRIADRMGRALREEIAATPTGPILRQLMGEQVKLIKSIPLEAAERVHNVALKHLEQGLRADSLVSEIMKTGQVSRSKAELIAVTETGRANTTLTQARAQRVGSEGYIWRTSKDAAVRPSHREMEGKVVPWNAPPTLDGLTGHAGALPRCRCFCEPVIPGLE